MNLVLYVIAFFISVYFWYQRKYGHRNKLLEKFPAPKAWPFLNHLVLFTGKRPERIFQIFAEIAKEFGPVWRFDMSPFKSSIVIQDPKIVEEILTSQKFIDKPGEYDALVEWLGRGLLISTGKKWHQRRKIITPAFHFKILEEFVKVMNKHGDIFVRKLKKFDDEIIDVFPMVSLYTLDVICESAMGYQLNAQIDDTSEYVNAVKELASISFMKFYYLSKRIKLLYEFSSTRRREKEVIKRLHNFTNSVINARRQLLNDRELVADRNADCDNDIGIKKKTAFLDLLLQVRVDEKPLNDEDIREEVDTFMFEGHDTSASAIAFALLNLAKYPEVQEKVYEECRHVFGTDLDHDETISDLNQLNYLEKVIKETLRLYPSVPVYSRKLLNDEKIGDYIFPANVTLRISTYLMGRDPKLFPDPLKFDPARFEDENNIQLFSFVPFSAGPRNCIGQKFAMFEIKSILSKVVRNFKVCVRKEDENPIYASQLVLRPVDGLNLYFKKRIE